MENNGDVTLSTVDLDKSAGETTGLYLRIGDGHLRVRFFFKLPHFFYFFNLFFSFSSSRSVLGRVCVAHRDGKHGGDCGPADG